MPANEFIILSGKIDLELSKIADTFLRNTFLLESMKEKESPCERF